MKEITFLIKTKNNKERLVEGKLFTYYGIKLVVRQNGRCWNVSEYTTGRLITHPYCETEDFAIKQAKKEIKEMGIATVKKKINSYIKLRGMVNE